MIRTLSLAVALATAATACATSSPGGGAAAPTAPAYTGPRTIHKGESLSGILHLGEEHVYEIELAADEAVTWTIDGESDANTTGHGCGNWGFAWHNPSGDWITGNPLGLAPDEDGSGARPSGPIEVHAAVPGGGEMVGVAGTWSMRISADPVNCAEIRYEVRAE